MTATAFSSPCAMRTEAAEAQDLPGRAGRAARYPVLLLGLLSFVTLAALPAVAAEAPVPPPPVPTDGEAAHQDLLRDDSREKSLDEAIFTEISPLTIPEIGIRLSEDQVH